MGKIIKINSASLILLGIIDGIMNMFSDQVKDQSNLITSYFT